MVEAGSIDIDAGQDHALGRDVRFMQSSSYYLRHDTSLHDVEEPLASEIRSIHRGLASLETDRLQSQSVPGFNASNSTVDDQSHNPYKMFLQPLLSPVTQEELAAEVKGIYAGLVMVEARSINIDAEQLHSSRTLARTECLSSAQWQSLIALRYTLLYEHHDFLMTTQHPSANSALRSLARKYCMPARMWEHGIHGFLEVLRGHRPDAGETLPALTDCCIGCLGDLARYRMAIEEDKEVHVTPQNSKLANSSPTHTTWNDVAARWYTMASDRRPQIGRLYHHLGILERPNLRKSYFYSRALTSVLPLTTARESLAHLCPPILQSKAAIKQRQYSADALVHEYHARVFSCTSSQSDVEREGKLALEKLAAQCSPSSGVPLAVTNIASLFEFGHDNNVFQTLLVAEATRAVCSSRFSSTSAEDRNMDELLDESKLLESRETAQYWCSMISNLIRQVLDYIPMKELLQDLEVTVVWLANLLELRTIVNEHTGWATLAVLLSKLCRGQAAAHACEDASYCSLVYSHLEDAHKPLSEDFLTRGIIWVEKYLQSDLFDDFDEAHESKDTNTSHLRLQAERVERPACHVAHKHTASVLERNAEASAKKSESPLTSCFGRPEPFVRTLINNINIDAFPDSGASKNFMLEHIAVRLGLNIDFQRRCSVTKPDGSTLTTVGSTSTTVRFKGERKVYTVDFQILRTCTHDIVLGSSFLLETETLTRYWSQRVHERTRTDFDPRLQGLDCRISLTGRLNDVLVSACPDTGSELMVMSAAYVERRGFSVDVSPQHKKRIVLADHSIITSKGAVTNVEWRHGNTDMLRYRCEIIYIVDDLTVDLILDYEFLQRTNAFQYGSRYMNESSSITTVQGPHDSLYALREEKRQTAAALAAWEFVRRKKELEQSLAKAEQSTKDLAEPERNAIIEPLKAEYEQHMQSQRAT